ncbi:hypothetical protein J5N97_015606 [Dioscorea zingiberensis]|uniref:PUM-HD domain-containing protein n=1 Tax=Dioscorea zingiberensis TaxID=325984 RepID=A0A9D5CHV7_9LILI|nr:hypothetical protein J5N97_015606 [Dioscorea zingiberensis]
MSPAWAMNVVGSKYLQELLEEGDSLVNHHLFRGFLYSLFELMMDANGRGLFSKLLDVCDDTQKSKIVLYLGQHGEKLLQAATHPIGTESVKRLIRVMKKCQCLKHVISVLASAVSILMLYSNGSSLVNYCVDNLRYDLKLLMFEGMISNFHIVARNSDGCLWLKKFIDELRGYQRTILLNEVINNSAGLSRDPYGNFVVQHAIKLRDPIVDRGICLSIAEDMVELSKSKSGSYVVEQCLRSSSGNLLLQKLAIIPPLEIQKIARNIYGNYVIQTAMDVNKDVVLHHHLESVTEGIGCPWFKKNGATKLLREPRNHV